MNSLLPERYKKLREQHAHLYTLNMLKEVVMELSQYDSDMGSTGIPGMVFRPLLRPAGTGQR